MRALVFADRGGAPLAPLDTRYAPALLPVAGKPLILYRLEELVGAGITDIQFVLADHADKLEALLGQGERWGASFRFALSRGSEPPSAVWPRLRQESEPLLVLRADLLASPAIARFLQDAQGEPGALVYGAAADPRAALLLLRDGTKVPAGLLDTLHAPEPAALPREPAVARIALAPGGLNLIEDLKAYHRANLDLVAGRMSGLAPAGREVALGLIAGRHAQVSPRSLRQGQAYVGERARISPEAELVGEVMIASDVVVDRDATVHDSVILPHTYVGELVEVSNAIVATDRLIRVDTGAVLNISDAFLLGSLEPGMDGDLGPRRLDRIGGVLLLLLSLPLWPLALLAAALARAQPDDGLLLSEMLIGNRHSGLATASESDRVFFTRRFNTAIPVLALLPRILAVIRGDLRVIGVMPLTPKQSDARTEDWQRVRDTAPVGLIGPTQLLLPGDAPLEEQLMSDAFFAGQRGPLADLRYLWQGLITLFSARAWQRPA